MSHTHYKEMAQYAEDAFTYDEPWLLWQYDPGVGWIDCRESPGWELEFSYRRKVKTIKINGRDIPAPLLAEPKSGDIVYAVEKQYIAVKHVWSDNFWRMDKLRHGLLHSSIEAAERHAEALNDY